jgi:hypothetical protein
MIERSAEPLALSWLKDFMKSHRDEEKMKHCLGGRQNNKSKSTEQTHAFRQMAHKKGCLARQPFAY